MQRLSTDGKRVDCIFQIYIPFTVELVCSRLGESDCSYIFHRRQGKLSFVSTINLQLGHKVAQWLSGRVLDSRSRGHGIEPHRRHCVKILEQDTFIIA